MQSDAAAVMQSIQEQVPYRVVVDEQTITIHDWDPEADHTPPHEVVIPDGFELHVLPKAGWDCVQSGRRWYFFRSLRSRTDGKCHPQCVEANAYASA